MFQTAGLPRILIIGLLFSAATGCVAREPTQSDITIAEIKQTGTWYQVFFDAESIEINPRGQMIIKNVASVVADNDATSVTMTGLSDPISGPSVTTTLSQQRVRQVRQALITAGVPVTRIETRWTGDATPGTAPVNLAGSTNDQVVDITVVKHVNAGNPADWFVEPQH